MTKHIRTAFVMLLLFTIITGTIYPLAVTGIAQLLFPSAANGSTIEWNGRLLGSELIGQQFTSPAYFWSRLSATGPVPYDAAASSGSNYGPLNKSLLEATKGRVEQLRSADSANVQPIPVDLVTASGSGLDPHISVAAALYQIPRVVRERDTSETSIRALVDQFTESREFGFLGEQRVNVLKLNLALDEMTSTLKGAN